MVIPNSGTKIIKKIIAVHIGSGGTRLKEAIVKEIQPSKKKKKSFFSASQTV